jgi:hypothetical protein
LLSKQPQFADRCPDSIYDNFDVQDWNRLEEKYPDIFSNRRFLSTLRKLAKN